MVVRQGGAWAALAHAGADDQFEGHCGSPSPGQAFPWARRRQGGTPRAGPRSAHRGECRAARRRPLRARAQTRSARRFAARSFGQRARATSGPMRGTANGVSTGGPAEARSAHLALACLDRQRWGGVPWGHSRQNRAPQQNSAEIKLAREEPQAPASAMTSHRETALRRSGSRSRTLERASGSRPLPCTVRSRRSGPCRGYRTGHSGSAGGGPAATGAWGAYAARHE